MAAMFSPSGIHSQATSPLKTSRSAIRAIDDELARDTAI
jgi:hypothetical protein